MNATPRRSRTFGMRALWTVLAFLGAFVVVAPLQAAQAQEAPTIQADLNYGGITGWNYPIGTTVHVVVTDSEGGTEIFSGDAVAPGPDDAWIVNADSLSPGNYITATADGVVTKTLTLADIRIGSVERDTNIVTGSTDPVLPVLVDAYDPGFGYASLDVTPSDTGNWSVDFDEALPPADLTMASVVSARAFDPDGDSTGIELDAPSITASPTYDQVYGRGFGTNLEITVDVTQDTTTEQFTAQSDGTGSFTADVTELIPGMLVTVSDGTISKSVTVAALSIDSANPTANTVTGTAPANTVVYVNAYSPLTDEWNSLEVTSSAGGAWTADFDNVGMDTTWFTQYDASVNDSDNDSTQVERSFYGFIDVRMLEDSVEIENFSPNARHTVEVYSAAGALLARQRVTTDAEGYGGTGFTVNFVAGMRVDVRDSVRGYTKSLTLPAVSIDTIDPVNDIVTGTGPEGLYAQVSPQTGPEEPPSVQPSWTDATHWVADFGAVGYDVEQGLGFEAWFSSSLNDAVQVQYLWPQIHGDLTTDVINGEQLPQSATGTIDVYAAGGAVRYHGTVTTDHYGALSITRRTHRVDLVSGLRVVVTVGGVSRDLTLVPLAITAYDPAPTPTFARGTATPGADLVVSWYDGRNHPAKFAYGGWSDGLPATADASGQWYVDFSVLEYPPQAGIRAIVTDDDGDWTVASYVK